MLFRDIKGQKPIRDKLIRSVRENRISHAQMFLGPPGTGKLALAIAYARYIACTDKGEEDACGTCPSCLKYNKLMHPDLHFVFPVSTTDRVKKEPLSEDFMEEWRELILENPYCSLSQWYGAIGIKNKQALISTQESNQIIRKLSLKSFESEYKVLIMWMPERMNLPAANKLLKIIEEPPEKTLFLLVSEDAGQIIPTILSRMQILKISPAEEGTLSGTGKADNGTGGYFDLFVRLMRAAYQRKLKGLYEWVDEVSLLGREMQKDLLEYCLRMTRENYFLGSGENALVNLDGEEAAFAEKFSPYIHRENIEGIASLFNDAHRHIEANANGKIVFLDMAFGLTRLIKTGK